MRRSLMKLLEDVRTSAMDIQVYTEGMGEADFLENQLVRRAVEREFEIIGEAWRRMFEKFPDEAARITDGSQIISFRNVLTHGYDAVEDTIVWSIVQKRVPTLLAEATILAEKESDPRLTSSPPTVNQWTVAANPL